MKARMILGMSKVKESTKRWFQRKNKGGISAVVATVGLCVIVLLLCVVLEDSLSTFVTDVVAAITTKAKTILG